MHFLDQLHKEKTKVKVSIPSWMSKYDLQLVTTREVMQRMVAECIEAGHYGFDLETTGLDTRIFPRSREDGRQILKTNVDIVGVCICPRGSKKGYYIPLRHNPPRREGVVNYPWVHFEEDFMPFLDSESIPVVHNCKFEGELMMFNGSGKHYRDWDDPKKWEDTLILSSLDDSSRQSHSLKYLSKNLLHKRQLALKELFPPKTKNLDYSSLHPEDKGVLEYATADAICTIELFDLMFDRVQKVPVKVPGERGAKYHHQTLLYTIEKMCVPSVRWMERNRVHIDLEKVRSLMELSQRELIGSLDDVYEGAMEVVGRDVTPLWYYLFKQYLTENNPEFRVPDNPSSEPTLRGYVEEFRAKAKALYKKFEKGHWGVMQQCEADPRLKQLLGRATPPGRDGVEFKREYDVLASNQLGVFLAEMGVPGLKRTESGQISTKEADLNEAIENSDAPFLKRIKKMRGNDDALSRLVAVYRDTARIDDTLKISYNAYAADTGRFSSKGDKNYAHSGGTTYNMQSTPSQKDRERAESSYRMREIFTGRPMSAPKSLPAYAEILKDNPAFHGVYESLVNREPRKAFMVAIDFSGMELRISAILANERRWVDAFFTCSDCDTVYPKEVQESGFPKLPPKFCTTCGSDKIGDLHTMTALDIFGQDAKSKPDWKKKRGQGKNTNFALNYGGGPSAIQRQTGLSKNESYRVVDQFKRVNQNIRKFWDTQKKFGKANEYVLTAFGRKCALPTANHEERKLQAVAERKSTNSPIQGTNADITKLAMGLIYRECKTRGWLDRVRMTITMHDELVFEIEDTLLEEAIEMIVKCMCYNGVIAARKWPVPFMTDIEIGLDWTVPWNLDRIKYNVNLRKELQKPGLSEDELRRLFTRLDGFYEGRDRVLGQLSSFEDMRWPEELAPWFHDGRTDVLTPDEKEALARAWDLYVEKGASGKTAPAEITDDGDEFRAVDAEVFSETTIQGFVYTVKPPYTLDKAVKIAQIAFSCDGTGKESLKLATEDGERIDCFDIPILVDPEVFKSRIAELS